ncbi:bifunctional adenosylcobinamide kinase/adenosylcobinamide-phosphate guanylyltransferase [Robertmurraya sp. Marseille-Q9965]
MHFVTGGAYNGKRQWVRERYPEAKWISAYNGSSILPELDGPIVILEGLEQWVKVSSYTREEWKRQLEKWLAWEGGDPSRQVVLIGTDISKGIVPMEKENRQWRDLTGWLYQDVVAISKQVDLIWYGFNQTIKG